MPDEFLRDSGLLHNLQIIADQRGASKELADAQAEFNNVLEKALAGARREPLQAKQNPALCTATRFN